MNFKEFVEAARWKDSPWTPPAKDAVERLKQYNSKNYFASFRLRGNVMRINPNPIDNQTPFGIYAYEVPFVLKNGIERTLIGGKRPFIWVITPKNPQKILHIHNSNDEAAQVWRGGQISQRQAFLGQKLPPPKDVEELIDVGAMTYLSKRTINPTPKPMTGKFHQYYLSHGIEGFVDHGTATIHPSEPYQAVFFGNQTINVVDVIPNNYASRVANDIAVSGY